MKTFAILLLAWLAVPSPALADEAPEVLTRNGKWTLNEDPDSCQLFAQFGTGNKAVIAKFSRFEPIDRFNLTLMGQRMRASSAQGEVNIDFGLGGKPVETTSMNGHLGVLPAMFMNGLRLDGAGKVIADAPEPPITPQQEASVTGLTVTIKGKRPFRLDFDSLAKPFALLRRCTTELVASWGYDNQVEAGLLRRPTAIGSSASWIRQDDYPPEAIRAGQSGFVLVRLDVDAAGKVAKCHVLERTDQPAFAKAVCNAIRKRARIDPALDAAGQPVKSYLMRRFRFLIG